MLLIGSSAQHSASAATIGLDAVHGFAASNFLATGNEHVTFRATIIGLGHTIVPLRSFSAADLSELDAAFFVIPYEQNSANYTASEIAAIQAFVSQRAVFVSDTGIWSEASFLNDRPITFGDNQQLLENIVTYVSDGQAGVFLGDAGAGFDVANMNALVAPYGISYSGTPRNISGRTVSGLVSHRVTAGVSEIGVDFQLPLSATFPSLDLTLGGDTDNVLAVFIPEPSTLALATLAALGLLGIGCRRRTRDGDGWQRRQ